MLLLLVMLPARERSKFCNNRIRKIGGHKDCLFAYEMIKCTDVAMKGEGKDGR
jgi:hypothetical protein